MDTPLIVAAAGSGLVLGTVLDPLGQYLADRSRTREAAERASAQAQEEASAQAQEEVTAPVQFLRPGRSPARSLSAGVVTGGLCGAAAAHFGPQPRMVAFCLLFACLVTVSVTDLTHRLVPRHLLYPSFVLIVATLLIDAALDDRWRHLPGAAIAGAVAFGLFFAVWWFVPRGMGFGDVRLAGVLGVSLGYLSLIHAYLGFLAGFLLGMIFGFVAMAILGTGRKTRIPFAPSLACGAVIAVFLGTHLATVLFGALV